jgi:hypothetical protein
MKTLAFLLGMAALIASPVAAQFSDGESGIAETQADCEVSSPVEATVNYSGPCATGWVKAERVEIIAG